MKQILLSLFFILSGQCLFAQNEAPKEITTQVLENIKAEVANLIPSFKKILFKQGLSADQIEFSVDTFRIEQIASKRMNMDYSTVGMNLTVAERTSSYDKLMNKYYNKLLRKLKPEDRKILVSAQKAWLSYRDAEAKLIGTMTKQEYSGGGTIQSNIATGSYADLVVKRTLTLFKYYDDIIKEK